MRTITLFKLLTKALRSLADLILPPKQRAEFALRWRKRRADVALEWRRTMRDIRSWKRGVKDMNVRMREEHDRRLAEEAARAPAND